VSTDRLVDEMKVEIEWIHFPLHPQTPAEGQPLEALFAGRGYDIPEMQKQMKQRIEAVGLEYGDRKMTFNSRLAQELAAWAVTQPGGDAIHDALFRAYFVDGQNIGQPEVLRSIAETIGLPTDDAKRVITQRTFADAVDADWQRCRDQSVTGVPTFVIGGQQATGAQPFETLSSLVKRAG